MSFVDLMIHLPCFQVLNAIYTADALPRVILLMNS
jgi:hypothetical protein